MHQPELIPTPTTVPEERVPQVAGLSRQLATAQVHLTPLAVTSKGDTSGLTRTGTSYKWQAAPAQPYNVRFRMQYKGESDGDTRISMWSSKYGPKTGSATRVEMRSGLRYRTSSKAEYGFSGTWLGEVE